MDSDPSIPTRTADKVSGLPNGTYFWRVIATNESGKSQVSFDYYVDSDRETHYGMKYLYISPNGQILEKQSE